MGYNSQDRIVGHQQFPSHVTRSFTDLLAPRDEFAWDTGHHPLPQYYSHTDPATGVSYFPQAPWDYSHYGTLEQGFRGDSRECEQGDLCYSTPTSTRNQSDLESSSSDNKPISSEKIKWSDMSPNTLLRIHAWYKKAFSAMHQTRCKRIAKIWIAAIEPGKVGVCPYERNVKGGGCQQPAPHWWPPGVEFKGPDRLHTNERLKLLLHLLVGLYDTNFAGGQVIRVEFLRAATDKEAASIDAELPKDRHARAILEQLYYVRSSEEMYLDPFQVKTPGTGFVIELEDYAQPVRGSRAKLKRKSEEQSSYPIIRAKGRRRIPNTDKIKIVKPGDLLVGTWPSVHDDEMSSSGMPNTLHVDPYGTNIPTPISSTSTDKPWSQSGYDPLLRQGSGCYDNNDPYQYRSDQSEVNRERSSTTDGGLSMGQIEQSLQPPNYHASLPANMNKQFGYSCKRPGMKMAKSPFDPARRVPAPILSDQSEITFGSFQDMTNGPTAHPLYPELFMDQEPINLQYRY